ncbi:MAG TPA: helix-turn-helix transcriptional regulator [Leptospiraceae bacterium]|nr:helix-turn-helix transcriptional regulator [Leptospiraceae bacterium]HRG75682.1 helix-turn-helix transcriptional regulator [Leptospiraceae bacterium]
MKNLKEKKLNAKGWKTVTVSEFLNLTEAESEYIELKLALSRNLQKKRVAQNITQVKLAKLLHSSQSRVAKMEAGDKSVSIDLLLNSFFALGATNKEIGKILINLPKRKTNLASAS